MIFNPDFVVQLWCATSFPNVQNLVSTLNTILYMNLEVHFTGNVVWILQLKMVLFVLFEFFLGMFFVWVLSKNGFICFICFWKCCFLFLGMLRYICFWKWFYLFLGMVLFVLWFYLFLWMFWKCCCFCKWFYFFLNMFSFVFENDLICCCTLASEYPHFKSSPINFTLVFSLWMIFCLIVSTTVVKRKQ